MELRAFISPTPYIAGSSLDGHAPEPMNHKVSFLTPLCLAWKQVPEYRTAPAVSLHMKTIPLNTVILPACSCLVLIWRFCFLLGNSKFQLQPWELLTPRCFLPLTLASPLSVLSFLLSRWSISNFRDKQSQKTRLFKQEPSFGTYHMAHWLMFPLKFCFCLFVPALLRTRRGNALWWASEKEAKVDTEPTSARGTILSWQN